jgi:carbonic anhydrase/acetyltransferase-like protein (isoleucine patch superfamily)
MGHLRPNVPTDFTPSVHSPHLGKEDYIDELATVIGDVELGKDVLLAPFASVRGDEGTPIHVGDFSNVQDGVVIHALETLDHGVPVPKNQYEVNGKRYAVFIGDRVSLAHQSHVHGPAWVEDDVFVGMQSLVFKAHVGKGTIIEPASVIIGVEVPPGRYVPAGSVIKTQADADKLPVIDPSYPLKDIDRAVVHVNTSLAAGYLGHEPHEEATSAPATSAPAPVAPATPAPTTPPAPKAPAPTTPAPK